MQLSPSEKGFYKFVPAATGRYRLFTSGYLGNAELVDTQVQLYSDASRQNLLAENDDIVGKNPYGQLFSKIEYNLQAGQTYYIVVQSFDPKKSLRTRLVVEDTSQYSPATAKVIHWEETVSTDVLGRTARITSLFDIDYYKIELLTEEQVYINVSAGSGTIEDINGNLYGYFSSEGTKVFDLKPGTYYLKVEDNVFGKNKSTLPPYNYELTVEINELEFGPVETSTEGLVTTLSTIKHIDATPGSITPVNLKVKLKSSAQMLKLEVFAFGISTKVFEQKISGSYQKGDYVTVKWDGRVKQNANKYGIYYEKSTYEPYFYAKDGHYTIIVSSYATTSESSVSRFIKEAAVTVQNNPLSSLNWVPIPPMEMKYNSKTVAVNSSNKYKCEECKNYFVKYVYSTEWSQNVDASWRTWADQMYGRDGLTKFWHKVDLFIYNPNLSPIDNLQNMADLIGFIPVGGDIVDGLNGVVHLIRGNYVDAALSGGAMIPFVGWTKAGEKIATARRFEKTYTSCYCFGEGTLVQTANGLVPIESIKVGDMVLSRNEESGETGYKPVSDLFSKEVNFYYVLHVNGEEVIVTGNHPFMVSGQDNWVFAEDLKPGDILVTDDNNVQIDRIEIRLDSLQVYNFTVIDFHTYFVTAMGLWTHNSACNIGSYKAGNLPVTRITNKKGQPSTILGEELVKAGITRPLPEQNIKWWEAHHIVPHGDQSLTAKQLRTKLDNAKPTAIDYNSAANGVWLPKKVGQNTVTIIDEETMVTWVSATHKRHSAPYLEYVNERIGDSQSTYEIIHTLHQIREELLSGKLDLGNVK